MRRRGRGYPDAPEVGDPIAGIDDAEEIEGVTVFHAGTAARGDGVQTAGGRVLNVTAVGPDFGTARRRAYAASTRSGSPGRTTAATSASPPQNARACHV